MNLRKRNEKKRKKEKKKLRQRPKFNFRMRTNRCLPPSGEENQSQSKKSLKGLWTGFQTSLNLMLFTREDLAQLERTWSTSETLLKVKSPLKGLHLARDVVQTILISFTDKWIISHRHTSVETPRLWHECKNTVHTHLHILLTVLENRWEFTVMMLRPSWASHL